MASLCFLLENSDHKLQFCLCFVCCILHIHVQSRSQLCLLLYLNNLRDIYGKDHALSKCMFGIKGARGWMKWMRSIKPLFNKDTEMFLSPPKSQSHMVGFQVIEKVAAGLMYQFFPWSSFVEKRTSFCHFLYFF